MKKSLDVLFTIFNAIIPVAIIVFIITTHKDYVKISEYEAVRTQIFERLDNVENLIYKLMDDIDSTKATNNKTTLTNE